MVTVPENVRLSEDGNSVVIIDQTLLPNEKKYIELHTEEEMYGAIKSLKVRGAPAIGICAAYCVYVLSKQADLSSFDAFYKEFSRFSAYLDSSRPTAVNLSAALRRMEKVVLSFKGPSFSSSALLDALYKESRAIQDEDIDMCKKISEYGLSLMKKGDTVLTHCNAGPLATSLYGTGLGTLILGAERGYGFKAYVDETRPLLQGARLTAYELMRAGIDCTLICDNMAAGLMSKGLIDACFVGCDRVAVNGDAANKTGTLSVAVCAKHFGVPFYVFCPSSTIDRSCKSGRDIVIEQRDESEITEKFYARRMAPENCKCYNPAFDVTPRALITAIITENGIFRRGEEIR